jgi:hypothetical protein
MLRFAGTQREGRKEFFLSREDWMHRSSNSVISRISNITYSRNNSGTGIYYQLISNRCWIIKGKINLGWKKDDRADREVETIHDRFGMPVLAGVKNLKTGHVASPLWGRCSKKNN